MTDDDASEFWREWRTNKQERHSKWAEDNAEIIKASGIPIAKATWTSLIFRIPGKPMVDFYPHTGRWRITGPKQSKTYSGGARSFLAWFAKQKA